MAWRATHRHTAAALRCFGGARGGMAAVEFAIGASFLIMLVTGLYDFGRASWHRMEVAAAAQAGAVYAAGNGFNSNGIVASVLGATTYSTVTATPAPTMQCGCPAGGSGVTAAACGSACAVGGIAGYYVRVNARGTYNFVFPYPGVPQPVVMTASTYVKLQ